MTRTELQLAFRKNEVVYIDDVGYYIQGFTRTHVCLATKLHRECKDVAFTDLHTLRSAVALQPA